MSRVVSERQRRWFGHMKRRDQDDVVIVQALVQNGATIAQFMIKA